MEFSHEKLKTAFCRLLGASDADCGIRLTIMQREIHGEIGLSLALDKTKTASELMEFDRVSREKLNAFPGFTVYTNSMVAGRRLMFTLNLSGQDAFTSLETILEGNAA